MKVIKQKKIFLLHHHYLKNTKKIVFRYHFVKEMKKMKRIICKLKEYTNFFKKFKYSCKTRKLWSIFPLKDPIFHKANILYKGTCTCKQFYIGETKRNSEVRWNKHCSLKKSSGVRYHLLINPDDITWQIISKAPAQTF